MRAPDEMAVVEGFVLDPDESKTTTLDKTQKKRIKVGAERVRLQDVVIWSVCNGHATIELCWGATGNGSFV